MSLLHENNDSNRVNWSETSRVSCSETTKTTATAIMTTTTMATTSKEDDDDDDQEYDYGDDYDETT